MKRSLVVAAVWFGLGGLLAAEEQLRIPPPPAPSDIHIIPREPAQVIYAPRPSTPSPYALQAAPPAPLPTTPPAPQLPANAPSLSRTQHLREAARHLEAAGYEAAAAEFRAAADALQAETIEQLKQKRAALEQLQREVAELEAATGQYQQVLIRCRVIEINRSEIENRGIRFPSFLEAARNSRGGSLPEGALSKDEEQQLAALLQQGVAKMLAEPSLVTTPGRPAVFRSGAETPQIIPVGGESHLHAGREFGVTFEAVPETLDSGALRLEVSIDVSTPDYKNNVTIGDHQVPGVNTTAVNTLVKVQYGEPLVIGGMLCKQTTSPLDGTAEPVTTETETLVILTAEPVDAMPIAP